MKLFFSLSLIGFAALLAGCSSEVRNPHQTCFCLTDPIASFGQDVYFGRFTPCFADGHAVPITLPTHCDYGYDSLTYQTNTSTSVTVSGSASVGQ
jgi:hypothetical protein